MFQKAQVAQLLLLGAHCSDPCTHPRFCLSISHFQGSTTGCSGLCWKIAIACDCLEPELSKSSQHHPFFPGFARGHCPCSSGSSRTEQFPGWLRALSSSWINSAAFLKEAFPCFLCCSNADNCNAMQKPQVLKAARFCFLDVN